MPKSQFARKTRLRDDRLYIISCEGIIAEPTYFNNIKDLYKNSRIRLHIVERKDAGSSPKYVLESLDKFIRKYKFRHDDKYFIVIDRDNWTEGELSDVQSKCSQKKINLIISNPCFELWLLLHVCNINKENQENLLNGCTNIKDRLNDITGTKTCNFSHYYNDEKIIHAIKQAKSLDISIWPKELGSRIFTIIENISK